MLTRLMLTFTPEERHALQRMAEQDFRPPKEQIIYLVRLEAQRRGLLEELICDPMREQRTGIGETSPR